MNRSVRLCVLVAVIVSCSVVLCLSPSVGQDRRSYEVPAQIYGIPAWHSDAAHAVEAYERLMQRYTDLTERSMAGLAADLNTLTRKLDAIDAKLTTLDARLNRIEQHLGLAYMPAINPVSPIDAQPPSAESARVHPDMKRPTPVDTSPMPAPATGNSSAGSGAVE